MATNTIPAARSFTVIVLSSFALAFGAWRVPQGQMPLDVHSMLWWSVPLAVMWVALFCISVFRFGRKALWLLLGAPLAFYWPVWILLHGIPPCYRHGNCV